MCPRAGPLCLFLLLVVLASEACAGPDNPVPTETQILPAVRPSAEIVISPGLTSMNVYTGIPFGPQALWNGSTGVVWGPEPFTSSSNATTPTGIIRHINNARAINQKLILNMTGGDHERYKTDGKFDLVKWKTAMNAYNTPEIKTAVAAGVADGTIIMNNVMDEPNIADWGGVMTKPLLDHMALYVDAIFPTLPIGVTHRPDWRPGEPYQVMDAILAQFSWRKGPVTAFRDTALAVAKRDRMTIVFSLNVLNGGIMDVKTGACPIPETGGYGTRPGVCRMTADQVRDWGRILGSAGCAMSLWRYDDTFWGKPENQQAFRDVAATLAPIPGRPCRRQGAVTLPPANTPPTAAFTAPNCTVGVPCEFKDNSQDDDGTIASRNWEFGNGETATGANPSTTFSAVQEYSVTLTVTDDGGAESSITKTVAISPVNTPPTAAFDAPACTAGTACEFKDNSRDDDGTIAGRNWDFGNGQTATGPSPSTTFATAGDYSVTLTVADDDGAESSITKSVTVSSAPNNPPTAAFTAPNCTVEVPCEFNDDSRDGDGDIVSRRWDFGNGETATGANPSTTFAAVQEYSVTLTVTDDAGAESSITKSVAVRPVNSPPTAAFDAPACTAGMACQFTDDSRDDDGSIVSRSWDFGNGQTATGASPSTTFATAKEYTVKLTVSDNSGAESSITKSVTVSPTPNSPPTAAFAVPTCTVGVACQFTDGSRDNDGTIVSRNWDFGNGQTATAANPSITFGLAKDYSVTLTVTDDDGAGTSITKSVTAAAAPPAGITLSLTGSVKDGRQNVLLTWSGAGGTSVGVYRDGALILTTPNDGRQNNLLPAQGKASYVYKVCEAGTTRCSASVTFVLPSILLSVTAWMKEIDLQAMTLMWIGASGANVNVYRNGVLIKTTSNTGRYTTTRRFSGAATYLLKVCETAGTKCSNTVTATFQ